MGMEIDVAAREAKVYCPYPLPGSKFERKDLPDYVLTMLQRAYPDAGVRCRGAYLPGSKHPSQRFWMRYRGRDYEGAIILEEEGLLVKMTLPLIANKRDRRLLNRIDRGIDFLFLTGQLPLRP